MHPLDQIENELKALQSEVKKKSSSTSQVTASFSDFFIKTLFSLSQKLYTLWQLTKASIKITSSLVKILQAAPL